MTQFMAKSFSVALGLDEQGRKNYDRIFGKKKRKAATPAKPTAAMNARSRAFDADDKARDTDRRQREAAQNAKGGRF